MIPNTQLSTHGDTAAAIAIGQDATAIREIPGGGPVAIIGALYQDLTPLLDNPRRLKQLVTAHSLPGLIEYIKRFGNSELTVGFINHRTPALGAVLDYHTPELEPSWCEHRVSYAPPLSVPFQQWVSFCDKPQNQTAFAEFIEEHLFEIASPDGATLLDLANTFTAKKDVNFASSIKLGNGSMGITYTENVTGGGGASGSVQIPDEIIAYIPVFEGGAATMVKTKFRYRIAEGRLVVTLKILNLHNIKRSAFCDMADKAIAETKGETRFWMEGEIA